MKILKQIFLFIIIVINSNIIQAQLSFFDANDSLVKNYHASLYQYNFTETSNYIQILQKSANNTDRYLFQVNYLWWLIITGDQKEENFQQCFHILDEAEKQIELHQQNSEQEELTALMIYLYKARIHVFNSHYYKALVGYSKMLSILKKLMDAENETISEDKKLVLGLYNYSIGKIKEKYPMFYPYFLLLPKADFELGKKWVIESIKSKNMLVKTEALYFLMKISLEVDKNYDYAQLFANQLVNLYPENILFLFYQYQGYYHQNNTDEAKKVLRKMLMSADKLEYLSSAQKTHFITIIEKDFRLPDEK